jgi:hypothetical protein
MFNELFFDVAAEERRLKANLLELCNLDILSPTESRAASVELNRWYQANKHRQSDPVTYPYCEEIEQPKP